MWVRLLLSKVVPASLFFANYLSSSMVAALASSVGSFYQMFRDGTASLDRDGVRLTSRSLCLELVGWAESPR